MKNKIILAIVGILVVGLGYLAVKGNEVQEIRTEIEISAPPSKVWSLLTDIDQWQEWSPIINESMGNAEVGETLEITMIGKEEGKNGPKYSPVITQLEEPKYFRWRAKMMAGFIFTNDKIFELVETKNGTRLIHKELFSGLLAPIFCGQMEQGVPPMLNSMNQALKEMAEKSDATVQ